MIIKFIEHLFCKHKYIKIITLGQSQFIVENTTYKLDPLTILICPKCSKIKGK